MPKLTENQLKAVESIDEHVLVSAGAGCGKTMVLVERYLQVLRSDAAATVSDIIAVTFTRKAAEEMRSRLKLRLRETLDEQTDDRARWAKLLSEADRARIGTIHSLCESVLKAHPAEAGVDPQFEVMDDLTRVQMLEQAVDESLQELIAASPPTELPVLLEYPVDRLKEWVVSQLVAVHQYREARRTLGGDDLEALRAAAMKIVEQVRDNSAASFMDGPGMRGAHAFIRNSPFGDDPQHNLEVTRRSILACLDELSAGPSAGDASVAPTSANASDRSGEACLARSSELILQIAAIPSPGTAGGAKGKPLRDALKTIREAAKGFADDCPTALTEFDDQAFVMLQTLIRLIDTSLDRFEQAKRNAQRLDYNDLIGKTHKLLTAPNSSARKHVSTGIRAVLVDEFQDTNRTQAELLSCLCGDGARLFLIGDDKQSIYKFQGADVSTFNEWKNRIQGQTHGLAGNARLLDLSFSFRSHPAIVNFVNRFFQTHFQSATTPSVSLNAHHRAAHQSLTPAREEPHTAERVEIVQYDSIPGEGEKRDAERAKALESRAIAAWILEKVGAQTQVFCTHKKDLRPIEFGDFAILVQANSDFAAIESALSTMNIPFVTFAGGGFLERQEIHDVQNMLRWLANPINDHALLGVIRSPFFSINDGMIHKFYLDEPGSLWNSMQAASKKDEFESLRRPVAILRQLLETAQTAQLSDLIRNAIKVTSMDVSLLAVPNGRQKSRNVWKMAVWASQYNHLTLTEFVDALDAMRDLGAGKQADAPLSSENAVKLMTIHKSKGLEFPAVILPVLGRKITLPPPRLLVHRDFGIAFDTSRSSDDPKPSYFRAASLLNHEMDVQEKKRLFYVAMTRARDFLVMFYEQSAKSESSFRLWVKDTLGIGEEHNGQYALQAGEHYTTRYVDDEAIAAWEAAGSEFRDRPLNQEELESLSKEIGFDLLKPISEEPVTVSQSVPWTATSRVTPIENEQPHATVYGNLFHSAMQRWVLTGKRDDAVLPDLAAELGVAEATMKKLLIAKCVELLDRYQGSELFDLLQSGRRFLPEVGYTVMDDSGYALDKRPDLIFQDAQDNWHIVDFKTDKFAAGELDAKVNEHSSQVIEYINDFHAITTCRARGWLYFAELGTLAEVNGRGYDVGKSGQLKLPLSAG